MVGRSWKLENCCVSVFMLLHDASGVALGTPALPNAPNTDPWRPLCSDGGDDCGGGAVVAAAVVVVGVAAVDRVAVALALLALPDTGARPLAAAALALPS